MLQAAAFYILAGTAVISAFMVVAARNPVRAVLFLILTFFSAAGLFVMLGAEFLAMLLVIVYVGAVAVLFLFVVMMLDVDFAALKEGFLSYLPLGGAVALALVGILSLTGITWVVSDTAGAALQTPVPPEMTNAEALGSILYDRYVFFFQLAGLVLLVAMIGAIVLTLRHREGVRRQNIARQVQRRREEGVELVEVKSGEGIG
ncbi:NADH dehydrogenase [Glycocaulis alkaliphilus]|uniref:NADH-quinone oxidoreductase subunit J n=1 Tax=Glycocaulis alkaliphilus TaxID=1434191 RepID=A0A3T0EAK7_9PROT|nr:NADH-quinone oxidoreductase subunit J [Glycocaulis alkaliphilus]AZU04322.1 NADH dehydrogenase [Glycocaulis alkaliphilus]GGB77496.1 NADH:ubiquinone oxidoreductase subunit J [Glycocaulis alkaliphilus]